MVFREIGQWGEAQRFGFETPKIRNSVVPRT
jgi:hypothetical protein